MTDNRISADDLSGVIGDITEDDERQGYEDAEDAVFWDIVRAALNDACGICGNWSCTRAGCTNAAAQQTVAFRRGMS